METKELIPRYDFEYTLKDCDVVFEFTDDKITCIYAKNLTHQFIARDIVCDADYKNTVLYEQKWLKLDNKLGTPSINKVLNNESKSFLAFDSKNIKFFIVIGKLDSNIEDIIIETKRRNFIENELEIYQIN